MNETIASLVLPHIDDDWAWLSFVLGTNKQYTAVLDKNLHWEEHFELKCNAFQHPKARFQLTRYVECKHMLRFAYDDTICDRYRVNLTFIEDSSKSFARQIFRQFYMAQQLMDAHGIYSDDTPAAVFTYKPMRRPGALSCDDICYAGDIFIQIVHVQDVPLIEGSLSELHAQLTDVADGMDSDDSFDCSECGAEQHRDESDDY